MERVTIKRSIEFKYNSGLKQVFDFIEISKPRRLIFPGGSVGILANDLANIALAESQILPECICLQSRVDVRRYYLDLSENHPTCEELSEDLWIEDFAGNGGKIRYLRSILPRGTELLLMVAPIEAEIPEDVLVIMRDDELAEYLHDTRVTSPWERDVEF